MFRQSSARKAAQVDQKPPPAQPPRPPPPPPAGSTMVPEEAMASTVKIYNHFVFPNYLRPWTKHEGQSCSGSGFAIEGRRILTNSHVVNHAQLLQVQRHDRPGKWTARLLSEAIQCDLALLAVDDDSFWDGLPLQLCSDSVPTLQSTVTAVGYPVGGENICVTRGVVSRVDLLDYTFLEQVQGERLLVLQIDAAINPGNSGGPVFDQEGVAVGVAFAGLDEADNIGYVIPMPVVRLFLKIFEASGSFGQLPSLGVTFQSTENKSLRKSLKLDEAGRNGLLVVHVAPLMPAAKAGLSPGDVVMKLDGHDLAEDGTVEAWPGLRMPWEYLVTKRPVGDDIEIEIARDGSRFSKTVRLVAEPRLVPFHDGVDASPSYVIVGGLVFLQLSLPLVDAGMLDYLSDPISTGDLVRKLGARRKEPEECVVLLASILESELTVSYDRLIGRQLTKFNGDAKAAFSLRALAVAVSGAGSKPFLKFEFGEWLAVLETERSKKTEKEVLLANDVISWCSADVDPRGDVSRLGCVTAFLGGK